MSGELTPPSTVPELRERLVAFEPFMNQDLPEVGAIHDDVVFREDDGAKVTADIIVPTGDGPHPVLVYIHGGGWVAGSSKSHRKLGFRFAEHGYLVFNVDYRVAPEAAFPTPFDDCVAAVKWAAAEAPKYGGDPSRLAIGGDSAGGNLSAAVAVALADDPSAPEVKAALLIYGVYDMGDLPEGETEEQDAVTDMMIDAYVGHDRDNLLRDLRVSPLAGAAKLPPSYVVVGSADSLVGQSASLAAALDKAGIEHEHVVVADMPHAFVQMEMFPQARETIDQMVLFLDKRLSA
jgi:acetyl esterase